MKLSERIKQFQAERAAKVAALKAISEKALKEGRTKDAGEQEQFDELSLEIDTIDRELKDLRLMVKLDAPVTAGGDDDGSEDDSVDADDPPADPTPRIVRSGTSNLSAGRAVKNALGSSVQGSRISTVGLNKQLEKGIMFARYVKCLGAAKGDVTQAYMMAKQHYPDTPQIAQVLKAGLYGGTLETLLKTAVPASTTTDSTNAGPLVQYTQFAGDFIDYLRPRTLIGQFGQGNIPALRSIPFNVHIRGQTSGGTAYWVGQGKAKPLTKMDFSDVYMGWSKIAAIAVMTEELLRFSNPSADTLVRDALAECVIARMDTDFIDPTKAAVANVSPASITNGVAPIHSAGSTAAEVRADVATLINSFITANIDPSSLVFIMPATVAMQLSLIRNAFGQKEFPDISVKGGMLEGIPVLTSQYVPNESGGAMLILVSAQDIYIADDGNVTIDASREASLEMSNSPAQDSTTPTAAQMVSMFQTNSIALRAERFVNWQKRRAAAVKVIDDVNYTGG
jgi:HK97 family phage major capsid protein